MLFRSLALGLLLAAIYLILARPAVTITTTTIAAPAAPPDDHLKVIDLAGSVLDPASLIRLAPGERITSVDDQPVEGDASWMIARHARDYIDVTIESARGERRLLLLVH